MEVSQISNGYAKQQTNKLEAYQSQGFESNFDYQAHGFPPNPVFTQNQGSTPVLNKLPKLARGEAPQRFETIKSWSSENLSIIRAFFVKKTFKMSLFCQNTTVRHLRMIRWGFFRSSFVFLHCFKWFFLLFDFAPRNFLLKSPAARRTPRAAEGSAARFCYSGLDGVGEFLKGGVSARILVNN